MRLIADSQELADFCQTIAEERYVTIDTEFMRDRTFWPKLCLVQIGSTDEAVAVDPLAPDIDLQPLQALLANEKITKVFHACRQDLEVFYHIFGELPVNVFDTQIAAMFTGYGDEVGYENLVGRIAKARLDKSSRFTDWARRPLSEAQLRYAIGDVTHLRKIFEHLEAQLDDAARRSWVDEELQPLLAADLYEQPPRSAWHRLKFKSKDRRFYGIVRELAAWRETRAQTRDVPRNRVMRDDIILEIAASKPKSVDELRGLDRVSIDRTGAAEMVAAIEAAMALPADELPPLKEHRIPPRGIGAIVDLLRVLLKHISDEEGIAPRLIATTSDLEAIAQDDDADVATMHGWRRRLFGERALAVKAGRVGFCVRDRKLELIKLEAVT